MNNIDVIKKDIAAEQDGQTVSVQESGLSPNETSYSALTSKTNNTTSIIKPHKPFPWKKVLSAPFKVCWWLIKNWVYPLKASWWIIVLAAKIVWWIIKYTFKSVWWCTKLTMVIFLFPIAVLLTMAPAASKFDNFAHASDPEKTREDGQKLLRFCKKLWVSLW